MKNAVFFLVCLTISIGCNLTRFKPPLGIKNMVSCDDVECVCLSDDLRDNMPAAIFPIEHCNNTIGAEIGYYEELEKFYNDKLSRLEVCLNFPKRCK